MKNAHQMKWREKWQALIMRCLQGTYDHFLFYLPSRTGLLPWLLGRLFTGIVIDPTHQDILRRLPEDAIIIYTTKFKSHFEYLFYHSRYRREKLPVPELSFGFRCWPLQPISNILRSLLAQTVWFFKYWRWLDPYASGYWHGQLLDGRPALLPLVEKHGFYRRFVKAQTDPLRFLIELQQSVDQPVYLVPHIMFFSKSPTPAIPRVRDLFFGTEQRPRLFRRLLTLMRQPGKVFVEISPPLELKEFLAEADIAERSPEYQALMLRRQLLWQHNRHRQSITGPVIKSHEEFKESILAHDRLRQFMAQYAETRKESLLAVRKQADSYLDEIAAKYNYFMITCLAKPIGWILNSMFEGTVVDKESIQQLKVLAQKGPLILIPCHKSHIDYLILSYVLFQNNMACPHIAAGKNLSFWPMGPMFRAGGAFFIRRSFRGAVLYARVFSEYIHTLLEEGFNIELFIEGGRSRTGKLLMPKLGFLTLLLNAVKNGACQDMIFVPVFIGYDQILEESAYLHEIEGGQKEPETLSQVLKARRFLKRRYGKIYINFHDPILLTELLQNFEAPLNDMPSKMQNVLCRDIGWRVINAINQASVVTPYSLVAAAALNCPGKRFTAEEIQQIVETYITLLMSQKAKLTDTLFMDHQRACEQALQSYVQRKIIEMPSGEKGMPLEIAQYILPQNKRLQLEYYKNNCIAHFVPAAITALAVLEMDAFQFSAADLHERYRFLQDFFKYEFAFDMDKSAEFFVRKCLKSFIDEAVLMPHAEMPDTYQITSAGLRKLKLFARFLKTYFESYLVVLHYFKQAPQKEANGKDRLKKIQSMGKSMLKRQEIELAESLSNINYDNGISFFTTHRIKGAEDLEAIDNYENIIRDFLNCI